MTGGRHEPLAHAALLSPALTRLSILSRLYHILKKPTTTDLFKCLAPVGAGSTLDGM